MIRRPLSCCSTVVGYVVGGTGNGVHGGAGEFWGA